MRLLYNLAIRLYIFSIHLAAPFHAKAAQWVKGRKGIWNLLNSNILPGKQWIWIHCASSGEFEQGRPLLEKIKTEVPTVKILLTFFSPSGYELRKNYPVADLVSYLPPDFPQYTRRFLDIVKPKMAIFIKYEFWLNYLKELKNKQVPTFLVAGIFRPNQHFFKSYGCFFRQGLLAFHHLYVQDELSVKLLKKVGLKNITRSGDTRFDRVISQASHFEEIPVLKSFTYQQKVIIGGSLWPADFKLFLSFIKKYPEYKYILVPHEPSRALVENWKNKLGPKTMLWSELKHASTPMSQILIIDTVGLLSRIYFYGDVAYMGGGFGAGIHNTLEAAVYGKPVVFGPKYHKFSEAIDLLYLGGARSIKNKEEFEQALLYFLQAENQKRAGHLCREYITQKAGATDLIAQHLLQYLTGEQC